MGLDTAGQGIQVIAALQATDDAAFRMLGRDVFEPGGDPAVVFFYQAHLAEIILTVGIEPGASFSMYSVLTAGRTKMKSLRK